MKWQRKVYQRKMAVAKDEEQTRDAEIAKTPVKRERNQHCRPEIGKRIMNI